AALAGVADAAVVLEGRGEGACLLGYAVAEAGVALDAEQLREQLRTQLPDYMLPRQIVLLAALPLTVNGKLDRKALPKLEQDASSDAAPLESPTEHRLAAVWQSLLGGKLPGRDANFFTQGGHSLLVVRLAEAIRVAFDVAVPLKSLFEQPRLVDQASLIDALSAPAAVADSSDESMETFAL
ncbi:hypothetical protein EBB59_12885, partial [Lysobacter pythonis]